MNKRIAALAAAGMLLLSACSGGGAGTLRAVQDSGKLRVGVLQNAPGYSAPNADGAYDGAEISLIKAFADEWGVQIELYPVEAEAMSAHIQANQLDLALGRLADSSSLQYNVGTSVSYDSGMLYVVSRRGDYRTTKGSLENSAVAVCPELSDSYRVELGAVAGIAISDADGAAAAGLLKDGQISAYLCYEDEALALLEDTALQVETVSNVSPEQYVVIFNKNAGDMKGAVDTLISSMIADGRMKELFQ